MITTKPVICLRAPLRLELFLRIIGAYDTVIRIFNIKEIYSEEKEIEQFWIVKLHLKYVLDQEIDF